MSKVWGIKGRWSSVALFAASLACSPLIQAALFAKPSINQAQETAIAFPVSVDVIPGKLKVKIFLHDITSQGETISCWSYVTRGLVAQKQKEMIFTLRREKGQKPDQYPREFLELFAEVYRGAEKGRVLGAGDAILFGDDGFMGRKDFRGIGYVDAEDLNGVDAEGPRIAGVLLKGDEREIVFDFGLTRVTSLLGMKYRYYPCPPWSDLKRDPVSSRRAMDKSILLGVPRVSIQASYYQQDNNVFLSLLPSAREDLRRFFEKKPLIDPVALRTLVDHRADSCLVWAPKSDKPVAISPTGSKGLRKTGAFLTFVPEQKENEILLIEDGHSLLLTTSTWQRIREALLSGTDVVISGGKENDVSIAIEWVK